MHSRLGIAGSVCDISFLDTTSTLSSCMMSWLVQWQFCALGMSYRMHSCWPSQRAHLKGILQSLVTLHGVGWGAKGISESGGVWRISHR